MLEKRRPPREAGRGGTSREAPWRNSPSPPTDDDATPPGFRRPSALVATKVRDHSTPAIPAAPDKPARPKPRAVDAEPAVLRPLRNPPTAERPPSGLVHSTQWPEPQERDLYTHTRPREGPRGSPHKTGNVRAESPSAHCRHTGDRNRVASGTSTCSTGTSGLLGKGPEDHSS